MYKGDKSKIRFRKILNKIPPNIKYWVEPFGGSFGLGRKLQSENIIKVYNELDINVYNKYKSENYICHNIDYKKIIKIYDNLDDVLFYFDPPYYNKEHYYDIIFNEHIELYNIINNLKSNFILSYGENQYIRNLYKNYNIEKLSNTGISSYEIIITK